MEGLSPWRLRARARRTAVEAADRARVTALRWRGFSSRFVDTRVGPVHLLDADGGGELPPLVLVHGLASCGADFSPILRHLRPLTRRLVVPDLPGHGLSSSLRAGQSGEDARLALIEALDGVGLREPALLVGNSLGGFAVIRYANARPETCRALVLVSPGGAPMGATELEALLAQFRPGGLSRARAFIERIVARPHWSHALLAWGAQARFEQPGVVDLLRLASTAELLAPEELSGLRMPVLLLWGRQDRLFGPAERDFFFRHLPAHCVREEPDFGHAPFLDRPRALAQRIHRFAREIAAASA